MATDKVNRYLNIYITSGEAQKALDVLLVKEKKLTDEIQKLSDPKYADRLRRSLDGATNPKSIERLKTALANATDPKYLKSLQTQLSRLSEPIDRATKKVKGELGPSVRDLTGLVNTLGNRLKRMSTQDADYSKVLSQYDHANRLLAQQRGELGRLSTTMRDVGKADNPLSRIFDFAKGTLLANFFANALGGIQNLFSGSIEEFEQADLAIRNLENDLLNLGEVDALPGLIDQAEELAEKFKFLDNDDIINAQDKLVTYGKLSTAEIKKLIPVIIDFAAKTGKDLPSATQVFIKALEGGKKGLQGFYADVKATNSVAQNFNILTTDMAARVRGAAETFGSSATGKIAKFRQAINDIKESIGTFIARLIEGKKSADELFDEAKKKTEAYDSALEPLLAKYDELKSKTNLNKDEQALLQGVIQQIVKIVPQAATEVDKYGNALDINKDKVIAFRKENDKFVQSREKSAIQDTQKDIDFQISELKRLAGVRNNLAGNSKGQGIVDVSIAKLQEQLIASSDKLAIKYKTQLTPAQKEYADAANKAKFGVDALNTSQETTVKKSTNTIEALNARKDILEEELKTLEIGSKRYLEVVTEIARIDKILNPKENSQKKNVAAEEQKKVLEELLKIKTEFELRNANDLDKELAKLAEKFSKFREMAHGSKEILLQIETGYQRERFAIILDYASKEIKQWESQQDDIMKKTDEAFKKNIASLMSIDKFMREELAKNATIAIDEKERERLASAELAFINSRGKKKLEAELDWINEQERQELASKEHTESEKLIIENRYRELRQQAEENFVIGRIQAVLDFAQASLDIMDTFGNAATNRENAELERDRRINDKKKSNLDKRLKAGTISQQQYDRETTKIQRDQEKREKEAAIRQFKRNQRIAIVQAIINGAQGIVSTFAARPGLADVFTLGVARAVQIGIIAVATAAQIASISSQKPPELAKGGRLGGLSHSEGGNPIIDGRTGQKIAEIERGEGVVNKHTMADRKNYKVEGTPSQIISLLNSAHGVHWEPGGKIVPAWKRAKPSPMNFPAIKKYYAIGGRFDSVKQAAKEEDSKVTIENTGLINVVEKLNTAIDALQISNQQMQQTINNLQLNGIPAYTILSDQEKQSDRLAKIKADATLK